MEHRGDVQQKEFIMTTINRFMWTFAGYFVAFIILFIPAALLTELGFGTTARIILFANWCLLGRYMTNKMYAMFHKGNVNPVED